MGRKVGRTYNNDVPMYNSILKDSSCSVCNVKVLLEASIEKRLTTLLVYTSVTSS